MEAALRLAASAAAQQHSMVPVVMAETLNFTRCTAHDAAASQGGACTGSWQPTLLLTCLKAAAKGLQDGTSPPLTVLQRAAHVAIHAEVIKEQVTNSSGAAAADQDMANPLLLAGRALHLAARALQQLHEQPAAAMPTAAHQVQQQLQDPSLIKDVPLVLRAMVRCVDAIGLLAANSKRRQHRQQAAAHCRAAATAAARAAAAAGRGSAHHT